MKHLEIITLRPLNAVLFILKNLEDHMASSSKTENASILLTFFYWGGRGVTLQNTRVQRHTGKLFTATALVILSAELGKS